MNDAYEREEQAIVDDYNNGVIDDRTFREQMRGLHDDLRHQAEEEAAEAYDRVMGGW